MKSNTLLLLPALLALTACDGLFGGLYDEPAKGTPTGFVERDADRLGGTIYIDARSYTRWTYLDLHTLTLDTASITLGQDEPHAWDIALHRYDVKTHDGAATVLPAEFVGELSTLPDTAGLAFTADADSQVVVDMSTMMEGYLGYAPSRVNPVLSRWLDVNTAEMPPIYTLSRSVYLVRLADGSCVALQFTGYTNEAAVKGFVTIRYRYPLTPPDNP